MTDDNTKGAHSGGNLTILEKQAGDPAEQSIQDRFRRQGQGGGFPLLAFLAVGGNLIAPWWSKRRDQDLAAFWPKSGHLSGAFYTLACKLSSVPRHVLPRDPAVSAHRKLADQYQIILDEIVEGMGGWEALIIPTLLDRWCQDNGWFWEVTGDGPKDGPIKGMATGLMHLDSWRCDRTGDYEFPVVYTDTDGRRYRLHASRVIFDAELSDPRVDMLGVGHCWVSRIIDTAQNLVDIAQYKQEKLGSRPKRAIAITKGGLDPDDLATALRLADNQMTAAGLSRYSKMIIVGSSLIPNADLSLLDLASLPDGFDEAESTTLAMNLIALTGGVPVRWLWPSTVTGATKADAEYQHVAGLTGGPGSTLARFANLLGGPPIGLTHVSGKFLPPSLKLEFDFQDDYQDYSQAQNRDLRSQQRERDLNSGVYTIRVAREQALDAGDISDAQFAQMELDDGRLENGAPILSLFHNPEYRGLLDVGVEDPLDTAANDKAAMQLAIVAAEAEAMRLVAQPRNPAEGRQAKEALAALGALKELYKTAPKPKPAPPPPPPAEGETIPPDEGGEAPVDEQPEEAAPESAGPFEMKSIGDFGLSIRAAAKGMWSGQADYFFTVSTLISAVMRGYEQSWREGAAVCGITPADRTPEEQLELDGMINIAQSRVMAFADWIAPQTRALGGYWRDILPRCDIWTQRYNEVRNRAQILACKDQKFRWKIDPAKESCSTCLKLMGKVYRASVWQKYDIFPRDTRPGHLECHGFNCGCEFELTIDPVTPGRPPSIP